MRFALLILLAILFGYFKILAPDIYTYGAWGIGLMLALLQDIKELFRK